MGLTTAVVTGVVESLIAAAIWVTVGGGYKRQFGQRIRITSPVNNQPLLPPMNKFGVDGHPVQGTLKHLPKGHRIWLVVVDQARSKFWPQGFAPVEYDPSTRNWTGYVNAFGWQRVTIAAVIAPPTTVDYFHYFQRVGPKTEYAPLSRIPPECKHVAWIETKLP